jgi:hypothetical protein
MPAWIISGASPAMANSCACCAMPPRSPAPAFWKSTWPTCSAASVTPSSPTSGAAARQPIRWEPHRVRLGKMARSGQEEGTRVRDGLRLGVTDALLILGEGFVQHPANDALRSALHNGDLSKDAYFQQLLRLIYRLIFVFSVEERGLLHGKDDSKAAQAARRAYAEGYALARLRDLCLKRRARNRFDDHWQALRIVFKGLSEGEPRLACPRWAACSPPANARAGRRQPRPTPTCWPPCKTCAGPATGGSWPPWTTATWARKNWAACTKACWSWCPRWTCRAQVRLCRPHQRGQHRRQRPQAQRQLLHPDSLVQELIKQRARPGHRAAPGAKPAQPHRSLLAIRVIDPACGSGHFLLAAARRLAEKLAPCARYRRRVTEQDYRHALREVVAAAFLAWTATPWPSSWRAPRCGWKALKKAAPGFSRPPPASGRRPAGPDRPEGAGTRHCQRRLQALSGDDKDVCKQLAKTNAAALKDLPKNAKPVPLLQLDVTNATGSGLKPCKRSKPCRRKQLPKRSPPRKRLPRVFGASQNQPPGARRRFAGGAPICCPNADTAKRHSHQRHALPHLAG